MAAIAVPADQLALYIALPLGLFVVLAICMCYCYRRNLLCFQPNKNDALLSDDKIRFTVDLSKKGRKKGNAIKFKSHASTDNSGQNEIAQELVLNPISNPTYIHTPAVGQVKGSSPKLSEGSSPSSEFQFDSQDDSLFPQPNTCPTNEHNVGHEVVTNPEDYNAYNDKVTTDESSLVTLCSENTRLAPRSSHSYPFFLYSTPRTTSWSQRKTHDSPQQIIPEEFQKQTDEIQRNNQLKGAFSDTTSGPQIPSKMISPPKSPSLHTASDSTMLNQVYLPTYSLSSQKQASTSRRRSSMQMPIDMRQINPKMYEFQKQRCPSIDHDSSEEKPMLHFTLEYAPDLEVLTVKIIQATNLQVQEFSGTTDPYVTVSLLHGNPRKSKIHRKTTNPEFEETFVFRVQSMDMLNQVLEIKSFDFDQFSRDECTGIVKIHLYEIDFEMTQTVDLWKPFELSKHNNDKDNDGRGDLMLALSYLSSAEKLTIAIQKARNLRSLDGKRNLPDTYVKVCTVKDGQRIKKKKTSVIQTTSNPVFNQALTFSISNEIIHSNDVRVMCFVVHEFKMGHNLYLGQLELGPACENDEERNHWSEMLSQTPKKPVARWHCLKHPSASDDDSSAVTKSSGRRKSVVAAIAQVEKLHIGITGTPTERRSFS